MRSELAVGRALKQAINEGIVKRNEVIVCSKGGFLSYDYREKVEPRTHIEDKYIKTGLFQWDEFVGGVHCLSVPYIMNQVRSKIDIPDTILPIDTVNYLFIGINSTFIIYPVDTSSLWVYFIRRYIT